MKIVKLNLYGEGYYSGSKYSETIFLLEEDYKKLNKNCNGMEVCLGELDGKYSEVYGEVEVSIIEEKDQANYNYELELDGDSLRYELATLCSNISEMIKRAKEYILDMDTIETVTLKIRKSKITELQEILDKTGLIEK